MKSTTRLLLAGLALCLPLAAQADDADQRCAQLYQLTNADHAIEPGIMVPATEAMPAYCRVRGVIDTTIRFEVNMPAEDWTGRFLFHAQGGLAGSLDDATSLVDNGFAMATTDTGHQGEQPNFYRNDNAKLNFAFRANHLTTVLAKRIIAAFYGREAEHSYLWGCSNGGRAALQEALRYPDDFDGIIAGAPAIDYGTGLLAWTLEAVRHQRRNPLTLEAVDLLDANSRRACDLLDGLADGVIGDPRKCAIELLELDELECTGAPAADCLTAGQIETARFVYTGVTDAAGNVVVPGVYPGAEAGGDFQLWFTGPVGFMDTTASEVTTQVLDIVMQHAPGRLGGAPGSDFDLETFDVVEGLNELAEVMVALNPPAPDFGPFIERGGKLIIYNGWHDHPCRAKVVEDFYAEAIALNGSAAVEEFMRVFLVPGMVHCLGGPGAWVADYIDAIVNWVEEDDPPDRILAQHPGNVNFLEGLAAAVASGTVSWYEGFLAFGATAKKDEKKFSRPLCPYPQYAKYNGTGDPDAAASFSCVED